MPELPDLNAFARNLGKKLRGKKLDRLLVKNKRKLKTPVSKLKKSLEGASIKKISRKGKELHFEFSNGNVLSLHLMLHGKLNLFKNNCSTNDQCNRKSKLNNYKNLPRQ